MNKIVTKRGLYVFFIILASIVCMLYMWSVVKNKYYDIFLYQLLATIVLCLFNGITFEKIKNITWYTMLTILDVFAHMYMIKYAYALSVCSQNKAYSILEIVVFLTFAAHIYFYLTMIELVYKKYKEKNILE